MLFRQPLSALLALGAALRFYGLEQKSVWLDESFSIWVASQPLLESWAWLVRIDQHPPLYYTLLHVWVQVWGASETAVRSLSAVFSLLLIPVVFLIGRRLLGEKLGLVLALLVTVAPFQIHYAQEARMYSLLALLVSLALYFLVRAWQDAAAWREPFGSGVWASLVSRQDRPARLFTPTDHNWLGFSVFMALTLLTHNTAVFLPMTLLLAVGGIALWRHKFGNSDPGHPAQQNSFLFARNMVVALCLAALLWSPWLPAFIIQSLRVSEDFWISAPTLREVTYAIRAFNSDHLPSWVPYTRFFNALILLIIALGAWRLRRNGWGWTLLCLFAVPWIGQLLVSLHRPIFLDRTLIWTHIPYLLLLSAGMMALRYRLARAGALILLLGLNSYSLYNYYVHFDKQPWNQTAAYVAEHARPNDLILFHATWIQIPFDYYFDRFDLNVERRGTPVDLFDAGQLEPKMTPADAPRLSQLIEDRERVWLIYSLAWHTDPEGIVPKVLEEQFDLTEERRYAGGIRVMRYERQIATID